MKLSLNWIKQFVDIPEKYRASKLAELLTLRTCEVESFEDQKEKLNKIIVGKILEILPHPNADKLKLTRTDIGEKIVQIICGAPDIKVGMLVPVALPGAFVRWHGEETFVELKEAEIRGIKSYGMICAGNEIALDIKGDPNAIPDLTDTNAKPGTSLAHVFSINDIILDIDNKSLTHRPDLWGHYGMAREFAAIFGKELKPYNPSLTLRVTSNPAHLTIKIVDPSLCRRFLAIIVSGITVEESPLWLKQKLEVVGIQPINNIVDATNYAMLETGHPLHAYDRAIVKTDALMVRKARRREIVKTLDHKTQSLEENDMVIENGEKILGLAGIMGGLDSEIHKDTREIILESGNWNPILIRKTSQRLGLRTDASQRYEKDIDPVTFHHGFYRCLELIKELCPNARIASDIVDIKNYNFTPHEIELNLKNLHSKIGGKIRGEKAVSILKSLGFKVKLQSTTYKLTLTIPSWRATKDITNEYDLIEEIARMYGYENIKHALPKLPTRLPEENSERRLKHEARKILALGLGFTETMNYSFYSAQDLGNTLLDATEHLMIENYLSEDQTHLRTTLLPKLLKNCALNSKFRAEFKLFECGRVYKKTQAFFPSEEKWLAAIIVKQTPISKENDEVFFDIKGALDTFLIQSKTPQYNFVKSANPPPYFHPHKTIDILVKGNHIGYAGEINPIVQKSFDLLGKIGCFELNFSHLVHLGQKNARYTPIPKFPGLDFDISVIVTQKTTVEEIENLIRATEPLLIQKITLFDIYTGENIGEGKKALAFHILLQAHDRTLKDEERSAVQQTIFKNLIHSGGMIRGL